MKNIFEKYDLQFFAEGVPDEGAGESVSADVIPADVGQDAGVITADAGQNQQKTQRSLEDLGVPKELAERHRARKAKSAPPAQQVTTSAKKNADDVQQGAAADKAKAQQEQTKPSWDELMKNPAYKKKMGEIVRERVKEMQGQLEAISPALEFMAQRAGMDPGKLDYAALNKAIVEDDSLYEASAMDKGMDVDVYKRDVQRELDYNSRVRALTSREKDFENTMEQIAARKYQAQLMADAAALKERYPGFDLEKELANPQFKRMVSPGGGLTLAQAYFALHGEEIRQAAESQAAQRAQQALARSVQSGRQLPVENGIRSRGSAPVGQKLYSQMTKEERMAYKAELQRRSR